MRPPFNYPNQSVPRHHQNPRPNGFQNSMQSHQLGMANPPLMGQHSNPPFMSNPLMGGQFNNLMPNLPLNHQLFNNVPNMPQQQLHPQFSLPSNINPLLPTLLGNLQFAIANSNLMGNQLPLLQHNLVQPSLSVPSSNSSQPQFNSFNSLGYPSFPPHQNHNLRPPIFSETKVRPVENVNNSISSSRGNDFRNRFTKKPKFNGPGQRFQKARFNQANNGQRKFGFHKDHRGKGHKSKMAAELNGSDSANMAKEKKRSFALLYTEKEIRQWREQRRKNYPTKANIEKKLKRCASDSNTDEEAKLRSQQLKEVLAKQAELGVEVAEVPSYYFSNTTEQVSGGRENKAQLLGNHQIQNGDDKKGRLQSRHKKRKHGGKDKFRKKKNIQVQDKNPSEEDSSLSMRKPTLLEKLLSADIKRDRCRLLQALKFMEINAFFKDWPEKLLKFPLVTVEGNGCEWNETGEDASSLISKATTEIPDEDHNDDDDDTDASSSDEGEENDDHVER